MGRDLGSFICHFDIEDTPPPCPFAVALAAARCIPGSRCGGRTGPWGHGRSSDSWDTGLVSPVAPGSLQETCVCVMRGGGGTGCFKGGQNYPYITVAN